MVSMYFWKYLLVMWIVLSRMIFQVWLNKENTNGSRWPVKVVAKTHTSGKAGPNWKMSYPLNERSCTSNSDRITSCADCCLKIMTFSHILAFLLLFCSWYQWQSISHLKEISPLLLISKHSELTSWRHWDKWLIFCDFSPACLLFCRGCTV